MLPNACPKPRPKVKPPKQMRKVNRARKAADDLRVYGSKARQKWVSLQPCAACGVWGYSQGAHMEGPEGLGLKKGFKTIAPLCTVRPDHRDKNATMWPGCHHLFDEKQEEFKRHFPRFNPARAARYCQREWTRFLRGEKSNV